CTGCGGGVSRAGYEGYRQRSCGDDRGRRVERSPGQVGWSAVTRALRRTDTTLEDTMHQHLIDVLATLDASRQALRDSVAAIPDAARTARPGPDRWSPVDIIEHLSLVESRFS